MARHLPSGAAEAERLRAPGSGRPLRSPVEEAGFAASAIETARFAFPSFCTCVSGIEQGAGNVGQDHTAPPVTLRPAVREEVRRGVGGTG